MLAAAALAAGSARSSSAGAPRDLLQLTVAPWHLAARWRSIIKYSGGGGAA